MDMNVALFLSQQAAGTGTTEASNDGIDGEEEGAPLPAPTLPEFCYQHSVEAGGWCFYDAVADHVGDPRVCRTAVAALAMQMLATLRSDFEGSIVENADLQQLRADVLEGNGDGDSVALLVSVLDQMEPLDL